MGKSESTFWDKVNKTDTCWLWTGCVGKNGTGVFNRGDRTVPSHRYSYELVNPKVPSDIYLFHTCNNKRCVNPKHIMLGTPENRLWTMVKKTNSCWEWTGDSIHDGYGRIRMKKKNILAHRLSYEIHYGPIPNGLDVLHRCDNPACVRPDHLFLGDQLINTRDMMAKGRHKPGNTKLTEKQVILIRDSRLNKTQLAKAFGVTHSTICDILSRKTWKHVLHTTFI